ncbi:hypothetical protein L1987_79223 [Smallanthus sonchifolius]|uniref:Uncharacterized protein n=1 Tax=Smallanthus sonchifolius TaxID=185202 RepID=A0ACB8ZFW6_9ASTR|nr:hypothetical protein L1987_79223 [Smallanthus sonchifolius]
MRPVTEVDVGFDLISDPWSKLCVDQGLEPVCEGKVFKSRELDDDDMAGKWWEWNREGCKLQVAKVCILIFRIQHN